VFTAFTGKVTGLKGSDAVSVNYTSVGAPAGAAVGSYSITVATYSFTTGNAANYAVTTISVTNGLQVLYSTGACFGDLGHTILQPINPDGSSVWKQGSTVPAKFRVCDANGNSIGAGVIKAFVLYQINSGTISAVDETSDNSTNDLGWRFDPTAQQWIFNLSTKTAPQNVANRTYYYRIDLSDGSSIVFSFGLK